MKKSLIGISTAAVLAICASTVVFTRQDRLRCTVETLNGRYVFSARGFAIDPVSGVSRPKAIIELIDFNGDGTLTVQAGTRSLNGAITRFAPSSFVYTVADDCTGTITFDGPAFDIFVARRGDQLWLIQTNPNNVFEGSATKTSRDPREDDQR